MKKEYRDILKNYVSAEKLDDPMFEDDSYVEHLFANELAFPASYLKHDEKLFRERPEIAQCSSVRDVISLVYDKESVYKAKVIAAMKTRSFLKDHLRPEQCEDFDEYPVINSIICPRLSASETPVCNDANEYLKKMNESSENKRCRELDVFDFCSAMNCCLIVENDHVVACYTASADEPVKIELSVAVANRLNRNLHN